MVSIDERNNDIVTLEFWTFCDLNWSYWFIQSNLVEITKINSIRHVIKREMPRQSAVIDKKEKPSCVQVLASGLVCGPSTYLRSGWNVMDGGLVVISLIDIFVSLTAAHSPRIFGILRVFRLLRTLRPLRWVSRFLLLLCGNRVIFNKLRHVILRS